MKSLLLASVFGFAVCGPVFAADAITAQPQTTYDWSGPYLGVQLGYGWGRDHIQDEDQTSPGSSDYNDHFNMSGVTGGVLGGYNFQQGNWVFGAEGDVDLSGVDGDNPGWPGGETTAKIVAQGSLRGRVGYAFDNNLIYATGGLAVADIKTKYISAFSSNVDSYSTVRAGWTIGAGVEHAFTPNWTARIDYRYSDFGRLTDSATTTDPRWNYHNNITESAVRIGVVYNFR